MYLVDPASDRLWLRMRRAYDDIAEPEDVEVLEALEEDIRRACRRNGRGGLSASLEDSLSSVLRVSERQTGRSRRLFARAPTACSTSTWKKYLSNRSARMFRLYSLRAAAGSLGEEMPSAAEDWVARPKACGSTPASLWRTWWAGRWSRAFRDGSLNLFRLHPVGSRQNKILLIQRFGVTDESARYTVKKYTSKKVSTAEDEWHHERIRLEPLNPEFEAWDVEPQDFAVVAEWLRVLE